MKIKKINKNLIREYVKDQVGDVEESRIDKAIREYLIEREEEVYNDIVEETFSKKTKEALRDMWDALEEMIGDLNIITLKEGDVTIPNLDIDGIGGENGVKEYINDNIINPLEKIQDELMFLSDDPEDSMDNLEDSIDIRD